MVDQQRKRLEELKKTIEVQDVNLQKAMYKIPNQTFRKKESNYSTNPMVISVDHFSLPIPFCICDIKGKTRRIV